MRRNALFSIVPIALFVYPERRLMDDLRRHSQIARGDLLADLVSHISYSNLTRGSG